MTNPPPTPPDPALWTWTDPFDRTFLGPDYTPDNGITLDGGALKFGPLASARQQFSGPEEPPGMPRVTLAPNVWTGPGLQVQFDWRYAWQTTAGDAFPQPGVQITATTSTSGEAGTRRVLRWANGQLQYGSMQSIDTLNSLGSLTAPALAPGAWQRVRLTIDTAQARIQVQAGEQALDVALPDDFLAEFAGGAGLDVVVRQLIAYTSPPNITVWVDNLAIRNGDGTADLSTGTANSSGGVRLGGEWRFAPGPPDDSVGSEGDVWADSTTGTISRKTGSVYVNAMTLLGAPGPVGPQGPQGVPGPKGDPGALTGTISVPVLLGDASPDGGLIIPVTASGGLAGYELLGVDGPPVTLATSPDGAAWTDLALPATLGVGTQLRLTRTDTTGGVSVLRARLRQDGTPPDGGSSGEQLTVHPDGHVTDTFGRAALGDPYTVEVGGFVVPPAPVLDGGKVKFVLPASTAAAPADGSVPDAGEHARIRLPAATWDSGTGAVQITFDVTHTSSAATQGSPPMAEIRVYLLGGGMEWCWSIATDGGGTIWFATPEPDGQIYFNDWNVNSYRGPENPTGAWMVMFDPAAGEVIAYVDGEFGLEQAMRETLPAEFATTGGGQVALGVWRNRIPASTSQTDWPEQVITLDNLVIRDGTGLTPAPPA